MHPSTIDLSLCRIKRLLENIGNPHRTLPPVIHVAGTNGKGSVIAYLRAIMEAAGHRVHVYTSPHLVRFNERIRLAGKIIDDALLFSALEECERKNSGNHITLFEITTAAAFLVFSRVPADVLLLEVGLGGRLDATNVIEQALASAITTVSIDHVGFLGNTIEKIAFEKAGIIKPKVPVIVGPQNSRALDIITKRAAKLEAPINVFGHHYTVNCNADSMVIEINGDSEKLPLPALVGEHQIDNATVAVAIARIVSDKIINVTKDRARGLLEVNWPARLQILKRGPLVDMLPNGWGLWLDCGHNIDAGRAISKQVASWCAKNPKEPVHLIIGMLKTKSVEDYLSSFATLLKSISAVTIPDEELSLSADEIAAIAQKSGMIVTACKNLNEALELIISSQKGQRSRVLIAGSLYLAGHVLAKNS
ncbi:folC bifunctional family protein [Candidatus Endolissoclinum faulkneri L2]|uniref:Dihydrofolate synthase/folylpolyglutamate synthase n=1 Tax=Candidatus Endolissoclinum faulkneri L2 TaxID=1193729 RepID=K7Z424_9PROT|nr:folylpolyglutamate synthase/dihydrofolate synthase family protein [Candidatus Endolissoclinum faulkneri]AFX98763.1 folC bifunctional family protein [Candidatus Endolissoclinum faulkneri L2]